MPIYKYECEACSHIFEDLRGFNDPNPEACPECGAEQVRKLISGGNFHLKGSGWYVTDYGGDSSGNQAGGSPQQAPAASPDTGGGDGGSTEGSSDGTEAA